MEKESPGLKAMKQNVVIDIRNTHNKTNQSAEKGLEEANKVLMEIRETLKNVDDSKKEYRSRIEELENRDRLNVLTAEEKARCDIRLISKKSI